MRAIWLALVTGMMPGSTGLVDAEVGELVDEAEVVVGFEEELGDGEVGGRQLVGEMASVRGAVG